MKNLHKKIGAMVLAGMVVFGGVAVSGVNSFAASNKAALSIGQQQDIKRVKFASKGYGNVLVVKDEKELNKLIAGYSNQLFDYRGRIVNVSSSSEISYLLHRAKYQHKKQFIKIKFHDLIYLIEIIK